MERFSNEDTQLLHGETRTYLFLDDITVTRLRLQLLNLLLLLLCLSYVGDLLFCQPAENRKRGKGQFLVKGGDTVLFHQT